MPSVLLGSASGHYIKSGRCPLSGDLLTPALNTMTHCYSNLLMTSTYSGFTQPAYVSMLCLPVTLTNFQTQPSICTHAAMCSTPSLLNHLRQSTMVQAAGVFFCLAHQHCIRTQRRDKQSLQAPSTNASCSCKSWPILRVTYLSGSIGQHPLTNSQVLHLAL